jgi:hypothetical protein
MTISNHLVKDQAISLLMAGVSTSQVASTCGVSDSYISQLKADPAVAEQLLSAGVALTVKDIEFDSRLESAEDLALQRIEKSLGYANMGQALMAFKVLNSARKRKDGAAPTGGGAGNVSVTVNLTLPAAASARYITNSSNEIVEVEGRTMLSATPKSLDAILAARATATATLPGVTILEKAAYRLDGLRPPQARAPRLAPVSLSADIL